MYRRHHCDRRSRRYIRRKSKIVPEADSRSTSSTTDGETPKRGNRDGKQAKASGGYNLRRHRINRRSVRELTPSDDGEDYAYMFDDSGSEEKLSEDIDSDADSPSDEANDKIRNDDMASDE